VEVRGVFVDWIEVNDALHRIDMDSAGGNVGRNKGVCLAGCEVVERTLALRLRSIAVDRYRLDACARELASGPIGAVPGTGEHDGATERGDD
jgi:hypothetical protein